MFTYMCISINIPMFLHMYMHVRAQIKMFLVKLPTTLFDDNGLH